jgi:hypothetical protein
MFYLASEAQKRTVLRVSTLEIAPDAKLISDAQAKPKHRSTAMLEVHQPGEALFRSILPEEIWRPFAAFPASARLAVVVGEPTEPGP